MPVAALVTATGLGDAPFSVGLEGLFFSQAAVVRTSANALQIPMDLCVMCSCRDEQKKFSPRQRLGNLPAAARESKEYEIVTTASRDIHCNRAEMRPSVESPESRRSACSGTRGTSAPASPPADPASPAGSPWR